MASISRLESLPAEILHHICKYIGGQYRCDLAAFSLASQTCHAHAASCLYHTIRLYTPTPSKHDSPNWNELWKDPMELGTTVQGWSATLERHTAFKHVSCLKVIEPAARYDRELGEWSLDRPQYVLLDPDDAFTERTSRLANASAGLHYVSDTLQTENSPSWEVLADFLEQLPGLRDFHWDCCRPLPLCVMGAFERHPSHCSLHLDTFFFPGYVPDPQAELSEWPILLSSRLRTVRSWSSGYTNGGKQEDYSHDAVCELLDGASSAIEHVSLLTESYREFVGKYREIDVATASSNERLPFLDLCKSREPGTGPRQARVQSFEFGGEVAPHTQRLQKWYLHCDTSRLRLLKLLMHYSHSGFDWLVSNARFRSLTTLVIGARSGWAHPSMGTSNINRVPDFLDCLPPLREIRFMADINEVILQSLLRTHGTTLRRLWFPPPRENSKEYYSDILFTPSNVAKLIHHCQLLEDLAISVPRCRGDAKETGMYKCLGSLPRLQKLALTLDCDDPSLNLFGECEDLVPNDPSFDALEQQPITEKDDFRNGQYARKPRRGHLRNAIINAALDEHLALSIFKMISTSKPIGDNVLNFEHLELRPVRGSAPGTDTAQILEEVGRWWLLRRDRRDDSRQKVLATRLRSPGDLTTEAYGPPVPMNAETMDIFHTIWPHSDDNTETDWSQNWSSWPLSE